MRRAYTGFADCLMAQSEELSFPASHPQLVTSSFSSTYISDASTGNSRLLCFQNSSDLTTSANKPVVVSSDSGIFTDRSMSASEQTGDAQASRSSSVQSVDRMDSFVDGVVRCSSSNGDRPTSALARGVQIIEYPRWNPNPLVASSEESMMLMEEYLSPRKLVRLFIDVI